MSWLDPIRRGADNLYESMSEGWDWLRRRSASALTRFRSEDGRDDGRQQRGEKDVAATGRRAQTESWGLLASNVAETDDEIIARVEAPGMEPGDFSIRVDGPLLIVQGTKRVDREEKEARYHLIETAYGRFTRQIPLPSEVDAEHASASYDRGVLTVRLPRAEHSRSRRIPIQGGP
ncbi:MAG TPA: Hsp20/alpha crystallin family protein [Myxococcota bacterium]|nr:Hsp20/alpha crystallin family protein [Myxococcota bacterium]